MAENDLRLSFVLRRFLESLSEQDVVTWANAIRWYGSLQEETKRQLLTADKEQQTVILDGNDRRHLQEMLDFYAKLSPSARQFLVASDESLFRWLITLRPEEVESLQYRTRLSVSITLLSKFTKYLFGGFVLAIIAMGQFGVSLKNILSWFMGSVK